ncbi:hypothetical protein [Streptomyces roseus]|uniref:Uncharacterized protein n=1 Tax=Streptomyces roseus TaxID=66430 RepID=A0A0J6XLH9_9ACTN|nr:hypothetical protein [Streptomyces roseus]KMO96054.1 hypothetical protein ACS04_20440 [Streptomyces roseus]
MSETTPNSKGPAPVQLTPQATEPVLIPADQVDPEDRGTLAIEYREGVPVLVVRGGTFIPTRITVVHADRPPVAAREARGFVDFKLSADSNYGSGEFALQYDGTNVTFHDAYGT